MAAAAPRRIEIVPWGYWKATSGFSVVRLQSASYLGGGSIYQSGPANGDWIEWDVLLDAGTWALDVICQRRENRGIIDYSIDGVEVGSHDQYGASAAYNQIATFSGITVGTTGIHTLRATVDGKHASSSNYYFVLSLLTLRRTGA